MKTTYKRNLIRQLKTLDKKVEKIDNFLFDPSTVTSEQEKQELLHSMMIFNFTRTVLVDILEQGSRGK